MQVEAKIEKEEREKQKRKEKEIEESEEEWIDEETVRLGPDNIQEVEE